MSTSTDNPTICEILCYIVHWILFGISTGLATFGAWALLTSTWQPNIETFYFMVATYIIAQWVKPDNASTPRT